VLVHLSVLVRIVGAQHIQFASTS